MCMTLNPDQFSMFERAGDLADPAKFDLADKGEMPEVTHESFLSFKRWDSSPHLEESIATHGVKDAVEINTPFSKGDNPTVEDGHHRIAVAAGLNPDMEVPVTWND